MLVVKSTLDQRIKDLLSQQDFWRTTTPLDATKQISNVSAVIKRAYDPDIIPEDIWRTRVNYLTWARRVSKWTTAVSDRVSTASIPPTADIVWWTTDLVFTASDSDTVARTAWNIKLADWTSYAVDAWNTWNISAVNYIYYDWTTTLKKTTTPQTAVWASKIMVCVAKNSTSPTLAQFQAFWTLWNWVFITADNIAANTITTNQLAANSIDGMTITWALIRTAASWIRSQLTSSYFQSFDANYERIRIWDSWYKIQFRDDAWTDAGYITWAVVWWLWTLLFFSQSIAVNWWWIFDWAILPSSDADIDLWISSLQRNNIYIKENVTIDSYVLDESSWYLRWRWNYVPYITWSSSNKTTNASIKIMINGSEYYVNVLAV